MHLFYTPDINNEGCFLNESESKHCIKVLRLKADDKITLLDGKGTLYIAKVQEPNPRNCKVKIIEKKRRL